VEVERERERQTDLFIFRPAEATPLGSSGLSRGSLPAFVAYIHSSSVQKKRLSLSLSLPKYLLYYYGEMLVSVCEEMRKCRNKLVRACVIFDNARTSDNKKNLKRIKEVSNSRLREEYIVVNSSHKL